MQLNVTTLIYWKKDHNAQTNEDALDLDVARGLYVVCDGVGEASFSNEWAPVLARSFIERPLFSEDPFELEHWTRAAQARAISVMTDPESLSGVSREKARKGAAATLCGMVLTPRREHDGLHYGYNLTAIGDSNFFHWRPDPSQGGAYRLIMAFPLKAYADFDSSPDSLNSRQHNRDNVSAHTFSSTSDLDLREGDVLFLATDAVSQWIFREYEAAVAGEPVRHPAPPLLEIAQKHDAQPGLEVVGSPWATLIDNLRAGNDIVDDDSIMIILRVDSLSRGNALQPIDTVPRTKERTRELLDMVGRWLAGGPSDGKSEVRDVDLAVAFGDGSHIDAGIRSRLSSQARFRPLGSDTGSFRASHVDLWRANANAFKRVTDGVRAAMRGDADPRQLDESKLQLQETWEEVREQLSGLSWMGGLVKTLQGMGIEQSEQGTGKGANPSSSGQASPPDARAVRQANEQVYKAIGDWITGRGTDASIVKAFDAHPHLDPAFAAAISSPVGIEGGLVSHMDIWRAHASGGDSPTSVPPRKQTRVRSKPAATALENGSTPKGPLPPKPGVKITPPPLPPPGDKPILAPKQPSPPTPPLPSSTLPTENQPPTQQGAMHSLGVQHGPLPAQASPVPFAGYGGVPYPAQQSNRTILWAVGGAALLGTVLLTVALVFLLSSQPAPGPGPATVTPNATATALSIVNSTATALARTATPTQAQATPATATALPTSSAKATPTPTAQPSGTPTPTSAPAPSNPQPPPVTPPSSFYDKKQKTKIASPISGIVAKYDASSPAYSERSEESKANQEKGVLGEHRNSVDF